MAEVATRWEEMAEFNLLANLLADIVVTLVTQNHDTQEVCDGRERGSKMHPGSVGCSPVDRSDPR
jgi:hypothetical protein